ncbi:hypothetical protein J2801_001388 [Paraburkholderia phenoliruptrix]|nr:hypothetical protein [Paraburkholderia phenoliruptrix]
MDRIPLIGQEPVEGAIQGYVIKGVTHAQRSFRPGDWPELCRSLRRRSVLSLALATPRCCESAPSLCFHASKHIARGAR